MNQNSTGRKYACAVQLAESAYRAEESSYENAKINLLICQKRVTSMRKSHRVSILCNLKRLFAL